METAQALLITLGFFLKVGIFATFVVGLVAVVKWVREKVAPFHENEEETEEALEWWKS